MVSYGFFCPTLFCRASEQVIQMLHINVQKGAPINDFHQRESTVSQLKAGCSPQPVTNCLLLIVDDQPIIVGSGSVSEVVGHVATTCSLTRFFESRTPAPSPTTYKFPTVHTLIYSTALSLSGVMDSSKHQTKNWAAPT
jgi:hypothetical protein